MCAHTEEPHVNWRTTLQLTASILAPIFKGLHVGGFDWLWKETKHSDVVIFQSPWNASWKLLRTLLPNWSDLPGMMGSAVWVKSKWGMFYGFGMMFLNSDLFVASHRGRAAIQTGLLHTLERWTSADTVHWLHIHSSWSPNSTYLHLDFYLLSWRWWQQTNTEDIEGQSAHTLMLQWNV